MRWFARVAAAVLALLAVLGGILWADVTGRYLAASEARVTLPDHVGYAGFRIPLVTAPDQRITVGVLFHVTNPSTVGVEIQTISFKFYMDDLSDTRPFVEKQNDIYVGAGGFFPQTDAPVVAPRGEAWVWANMTVDGGLQPDALIHLNRTFFGRYYPIVDAGMVYRIEGTTVVDRILGLVYVTQSGVSPDVR